MSIIFFFSQLLAEYMCMRNWTFAVIWTCLVIVGESVIQTNIVECFKFVMYVLNERPFLVIWTCLAILGKSFIPKKNSPRHFTYKVDLSEFFFYGPEVNEILNLWDFSGRNQVAKVFNNPVMLKDMQNFEYWW